MTITPEPTPEDVAALVDETTAVLTGEKEPETSLSTDNETIVTPPTATDATPEPIVSPETPEPEKPDRFGRPSKYTPEILDKAMEYLDSCIDKTVVEEVYVEGVHDEDAEVEDEEKDPDEEDAVEKRYKKKPIVRYEVKRYIKLPNIGGLAVHLKVTRPTLYDWAREHSDFSYIMERLQSIQEERLINGGISGSYNPTISKVILTKHGYREGIDQTTNDKDLNVNAEKIQKKADAILKDD